MWRFGSKHRLWEIFGSSAAIFICGVDDDEEFLENEGFFGIFGTLCLCGPWFIVSNFRTTLNAATAEYSGQYQWLVVTHHKSTQTVAKHAADSDIENYVDAGFEQVMDEFDVDFVLGGHDHVYSRSYVLKDGQRNAERLDDFHDPDGTIYLTGNCCSDMQYYMPFEKVDKGT